MGFETYTYEITIILVIHKIFLVGLPSPRKHFIYFILRNQALHQLALSVSSRLSGDSYLAEMKHSHCIPRHLGTARHRYYAAKPRDHPRAAPSCVRQRQGPCCDKKDKPPLRRDGALIVQRGLPDSCLDQSLIDSSGVQSNSCACWSISASAVVGWRLSQGLLVNINIQLSVITPESQRAVS